MIKDVLNATPTTWKVIGVPKKSLASKQMGAVIIVVILLYFSKWLLHQPDTLTPYFFLVFSSVYINYIIQHSSL